MSKIINVFFIIFFSMIAVAHATPKQTSSTSIQTSSPCQHTYPSNPDFCDAFRKAAPCYCKENMLKKHLPKDLVDKSCVTTDKVYQYLISSIGINAACYLQTETSRQDCLASWKCYKDGGTFNINGKTEKCSGTGIKCS